jgi:glycosyltransferase involved in cell wall biosynthesis
MKVLIVNAFDARGGAAKAAIRLHHALDETNIVDLDNQMLVQFQLGLDHKILTEHHPFNIFLNKALSKLDALIGKVLLKNVNNYSAAWFSSIKIIHTINKLKPDIVHLHWTCNGMISIEDIPKIDAPVVWTMHDNWIFSGGCHNMTLCSNHQIDTHKCNRFFNFTYNRKSKAFAKKTDLYFLSLSKWLHKLALNSPLIGNRINYQLPNPINTKVFIPEDMESSRRLFNLPLNKKIILYGALHASSDRNKGFHLLCEALEKLDNTDIYVVTFGEKKPLSFSHFQFHHIGEIHDEGILNSLLNTGDLIVVPSMQENFSNLILESLAASIPVVGFDVGGNKDLILHLKNGYLANPFDAQDLKNGIEWVLSHNQPDVLKECARNVAVENFDSEIIAIRYIQMYESIIKKNKKNK